MAPFKKHLTPLSKRGTITKHVGKGASEAPLPARGALNTLTAGDPAERTMQNYAKATPLANPAAPAPDMQGLGPSDVG